jgi:hypothetical protein
LPDSSFPDHSNSHSGTVFSQSSPFVESATPSFSETPPYDAVGTGNFLSGGVMLPAAGIAAGVLIALGAILLVVYRCRRNGQEPEEIETSIRELATENLLVFAAPEEFNMTEASPFAETVAEALDDHLLWGE